MILFIPQGNALMPVFDLAVTGIGQRVEGEVCGFGSAVTENANRLTLHIGKHAHEGFNDLIIKTRLTRNDDASEKFIKKDSVVFRYNGRYYQPVQPKWWVIGGRLSGISEN